MVTKKEVTIAEWKSTYQGQGYILIAHRPNGMVAIRSSERQEYNETSMTHSARKQIYRDRVKNAKDYSFLREGFTDGLLTDAQYNKLLKEGGDPRKKFDERPFIGKETKSSSTTRPADTDDAI